MKKKLIALLILMTLIISSSLVWADTNALSKLNPVKFSITPDMQSLVVKYGNSVFINGFKGKDTYLLKCDTKLNVLWELKLSSLATEAEIYGGYLYAVSQTNIMKISLDGKVVWDVKIPFKTGRFNPVGITVVGTQIFTNGFHHLSTDTYLGSIMCSTDGKTINMTTFKHKTNSCGNNYYYQGLFYLDSGDEHYVATNDNIKFKDITRSDFYAHYTEKKRIETNLYATLEEVGNAKNFVVRDQDQTVLANLSERFNNSIFLDAQTLFGVQVDSNYRAVSFSLVKGINHPSDATTKEQPITITTNVLKNIVNEDTLTTEIDKIVNQFYEIIGNRTESANNISLLLERALTKITALDIASGDTIDQTKVKNVLTTYSQKSEFSKGLLEHVFHTRGIKKYITFNVTDHNAMINLASDLYSPDYDGIILNAPEMSIIIASEALKEVGQYTNFNLQFSTKDNLPTLSISQNLKNPMIIGIATTLKTTDTITLFDEKGVNLGGRYNPVTGQLETRVKTGGTYTVKNVSNAFSDISLQNDEVKNAIKILSAKGIMAGKSDTTFNPDAPITRAEVAGIMLNLTCLLEDGKDLFTDVKSTDWYYKIASSAKLSGIMGGTTATTFSPKTLITKEQLITILSTKLQNDSKYENPSSFRIYSEVADKNLVSDWAQSHFAFAGYENILIDNSLQYLDPKANLTRGETALLIYKFYKNW